MKKPIDVHYKPARDVCNVTCKHCGAVVKNQGLAKVYHIANRCKKRV